MLDTLLAWGKAVAAFFGFGEKVTAEIHDANQRTAGENKIVADDNANAARAAEHALEAANNLRPSDTDSSLRSGSF